MGTSKRLFQYKPKQLRGFLALSAELRNQIYQYYFDNFFRCELVAQNHQLKAPPKAKTVKLWAGAFHLTTNPLRYTSQSKEAPPQPIVLRVSRPLGKYSLVEALKTNWPTCLSALPLTCRQIYSETLVLLYNATVFVCAAPARLNSFLATARLEFVMRFELHYATYGDPRLSQDRVWQEKHVDAWFRACTAASKKLRNLKDLKIYVHVASYSPRLNLRQTWVTPLLEFRRLTRARSGVARLSTLEIDFRTGLSDCSFNGNRQLACANQDLHQLFGKAIKDAVLGETETVAMKAFKEKWEGDYAAWQHHLSFGPTGW
ncbi:hypothetical protein DE146DRAFT_652500 [Phaeosphaeria sp. MPI-PUGE-AT-0046c]|nr:hypothetical protein DE146DRAFT_652500 [Phaeosphaeria sp. MPI-PUGE-AT-0046c]